MWCCLWTSISRVRWRLKMMNPLCERPGRWWALNQCHSLCRSCSFVVPPSGGICTANDADFRLKAGLQTPSECQWALIASAKTSRKSKKSDKNFGCFWGDSAKSAKTLANLAQRVPNTIRPIPGFARAAASSYDRRQLLENILRASVVRPLSPRRTLCFVSWVD